MKQYLLIHALAALLCLAGATPALGLKPDSANTPQPTSLLILHTNDTHSCVMPISKQFADTAQADKGGFLRRWVFVNEQRTQQDSSLLLFDSGDFSQGSPYYSLFRGEVEVKLMNQMQYDAVALGNHEFDFGMENLARLLRLAHFPMVCANYNFAATPLNGLIKPYVVLERKGVRIGVFGLSPNPDGLIAKDRCEGIVFENPVTAAQRTVKQLRHLEHCDVVICLSHLGWEIEGDNDAKLIAETQGIDVVLGGHSHTYFKEPEFVMNADEGYVVCNQMGKNGRFVGTLLLELRPAAATQNTK